MGYQKTYSLKWTFGSRDKENAPELIGPAPTNWRSVLLLMLVAYVLNVIFRTNFAQGFLHYYPLINEKVTALTGLTLNFWKQLPYEGHFVLFRALTHPVFTLALVLVYLPFFVRRPLWKEIEDQKPVRWIVGAAIFVLSWDLSTYQYNFFFDQAHHLDRFLLIAFGALSLWRMWFLPGFIIMVLLMQAQFSYPLDTLTTVDKKVLIDLLIFFYAYVVTRIIFVARLPSFGVLAICMMAAAYFIPGVAKIGISPHGYEWVFDNQMGAMMANAFHKGWLSGWDATSRDQLLQLMDQYGAVVQSIFICFELGALLIMRNLKTTLVLLSGFVVLHLGLLLTGGIFFWKWLVVDLVIMGLLLFNRGGISHWYGSMRFQWSIVLILLIAWVFKPHKLSWFGSELNYVFSYELVGESGNQYLVERNDMAPYDMQFQVDRFWYLLDEPTLQISGLGYSFDYEVTGLVNEASPEEISGIEQEFGKVRYDTLKEERLAYFIRQYFRHYNRGTGAFSWNNWAPPRHFNNSLITEKIPLGEKVQQFNIYLDRTLYDQGEVQVLEHRLQKSVTIE